MKKGFKSFGVLALSVLGLVGCGGTSSSSANAGNKLKAGLIALHDSNSTYDKNFIDAFNAACTAKGVTPVIATGIPEGTAAYDKAVEFAEAGCNYVFADSFGHEAHILKAAKEFKNVEFAHATGTTAHTEKLANFHNAFANIYEGRYLAGVAAGLKLQAMLEENPNTSKTIGYVGAYPYAEVKSGYTAYFLGVRSVVSDVTMKVDFTNEWYHETKEKTSAEKLIAEGCSIISQHADSMGAPSTCETKKVPNVTYNGSTEQACPNTYVISSRINWQFYFEYCFDQMAAKKAIDTDYVGDLGSTLYNGAVALGTPGKKAAVANTEAKLNEVAAKLKDHTLRVFDTAKFTVNGEHITSYRADVDSDEERTPDTEVIKTDETTGITYFAESEFRSAPYFDIDIDGITLLN